MDNPTNSRADDLQLRDSSRLVELAMCKSEDLSLSGKGVAFSCSFVLIVFAHVNYHRIFVLLSYPWKRGEDKADY